MDKNKILETVFKTIDDSTEWGIECTDNSYGHWVNGVMALATDLIDKIEKENKSIYL